MTGYLTRIGFNCQMMCTHIMKTTCPREKWTKRKKNNPHILGFPTNKQIVQLGVEEGEAILVKSYENISLHCLEFI